MQHQDTALVVVVEDDAELCRALTFALEIEGYAVRCYADAESCLQSGDRHPGACFVVDHGLPGMNGLDLLGHLAADAAVSAILITTHPGPALRRRAHAAGVPIVEKPLLGNTLADAIRSAFESRATGQAIRPSSSR